MKIEFGYGCGSQTLCVPDENVLGVLQQNELALPEKTARLYDILSSAISDYEETYQTRLNHFQIASLTLIFRKFTNRNKLAGRNRKKLVIVTNSSIEKIDFFMERMKFRSCPKSERNKVH